jgi:hypothetical protein
MDGIARRLKDGEVRSTNSELLEVEVLVRRQHEFLAV